MCQHTLLFCLKVPQERHPSGATGSSGSHTSKKHTLEKVKQSLADRMRTIQMYRPPQERFKRTPLVNTYYAEVNKPYNIAHMNFK